MLVNVNTIYCGGSSGRNLYDSQKCFVPDCGAGTLALRVRARGRRIDATRPRQNPDGPGPGRYGVQLGGAQTKTATLFTLTPPIFGNFPTAAR